MGRVRIAAVLATAAIAMLAGCAPTTSGPPQPGERLVITDRQSGRRIETTYGELTAVAAFAELRNRNYGRAISISTQALNSQALTPKERSLNHTARGIAHLILNDATAARTDFDSAITHDEQNFLAWSERGSLSGAQRLYAEALADLDRSIAIRPTAFAHFERGRVKLLQRNLAGAREDFDQAVGLNPKFASAYFARGLTHHLAGALGRARADYQAAIDLNPDLEAARRGLALLARRAPAPDIQPRSRPADVVQF
jgi:tetratricopeptide (TPR) repeat protein